MFFWCRMHMKECLSLSSKWMVWKGKCRWVAVGADICLMDLKIWRAVASWNLTRHSPILTVIIVSGQRLNWTPKSSVMRHCHWSGSFWHFEGLWSNAEDKAVDPSDTRIHSPIDSVTFQQSEIFSTSAMRTTNLAISLVLGIVVEWLAVLPCVWVLWVADRDFESRSPDWHFARKVQGSISS